MSTEDSQTDFTSRVRKTISLEGETEQLTSADYELIGRFIQAYCISDYTSRRIVAAMRSIALSPAMDVAKLSDKDVIEHLRRCGESWTGKKGSGSWVVTVAKTLEMHHHLRHAFAHFAARRIKGEDAFLLLTTSANHRDPPTGVKITTEVPDEPREGTHLASFRAVPLQELRDELLRLQKNAQGLSEFAYHLEKNLAQLRAENANPGSP